MDPIVEEVKEIYDQRSERGWEKYGLRLIRTDLTTVEWLIHLQEELMDATLYIQRLKRDLLNPAQLPLELK